MKYEIISTEQIKKIYNNPEILKQWFPNAFLEAGRWYLITKGFRKALFNFSGNFSSDGYPLGYGFGLNEEWFDLNDIGWGYDEIRPATIGEVAQALIKEAKKRGFKKGVKFKSLDGYDYHTIGRTNKWFESEGNFLRILAINSEWFINGGNRCARPAIFLNGVWAEIIEETEIELTLDEIAEKFGVDKVKIKQ